MEAAAARGAEALRSKIASLLPAGEVQDELERYVNNLLTPLNNLLTRYRTSSNGTRPSVIILPWYSVRGAKY